jgi:hypothetical protein
MELGARTVAQVRQATAMLEAASRALDDVTADDAITLARVFAHAEKVAMAATRRAVLRAGDEGSRKHGGERDMARLAARLTGTTITKAKQGLKSAEQAASCGSVERAYISGSLSFDQAAVVSEMAAKAPASAAELVHEAERTSLAGLRAKAAAQAAALKGEEAALERERRLVARRFCRAASLPDGGVRLEALLPTTEGAAVMKTLGELTDRCWRRARADGRDLSMDQAGADALVALFAGGAGVSTPGSAELIVTVDAAALVRGETHEGERCQIEGVGPVPVATARGLLGEALLTICVTEGRDVRTVTSTSRVVPSRVRKALAVRDPTCVVPGCGQRNHLEIDHWHLDFSRGGLTALDNLCRLCPAHHRLKTRTGWSLSGGPGRWQWAPPRRRTARLPAASRVGFVERLPERSAGMVGDPASGVEPGQRGHHQCFDRVETVLCLVEDD